MRTEVIYTGTNHPVLENGKTYSIFKPETVTEKSTGLQVMTETGFCGIMNENFTFVEGK